MLTDDDRWPVKLIEKLDENQLVVNDVDSEHMVDVVDIKLLSEIHNKVV